MILRSPLSAPLFLLLLLVASGCTYPEEQPDTRPGSSELTFKLVSQRPTPGQTGVQRDAVVDLVFSQPPDGASVAAAYVRLFSGLYESIGSIKVDLLQQRIRFAVSSPLRANLRHQLFISERIRGLNGATLAENIFADFTTGQALSTDAPPATPRVTARDLQPLWDTHCVSCHGASAPRRKVDLSSPAAAVASLRGAASADGRGQRVTPGDHSRSYLMLKLLDRGGIIGFPMPPVGPRLERKQLQQVADWIDGGALP